MEKKIGPFRIEEKVLSFWLKASFWIVLTFVIGYIVGDNTITLEGGKYGHYRALTNPTLNIVIPAFLFTSLIGLFVVQGLLDKEKIKESTAYRLFWILGGTLFSTGVGLGGSEHIVTFLGFFGL